MSSAKPPEEQNLLFLLMRSLMRTDLKMADVAEYLLTNVPTQESRVRLMMMLSELIRCGAPEDVCPASLTVAQQLLACFLLFVVGRSVQAGDIASRLILDVCDNAFENPRDSHVRVFLLYLIGSGIIDSYSQYPADIFASRFFPIVLNVPTEAEENKLRAIILQERPGNPAAPFTSQNPSVQSAFAGVVQDTAAGMSVESMQQNSVVNTEMALRKLLTLMQDVYAPSLPLSFAPIAPPLLELGDDELPFTYPSTSCDRHALDMAFPTTRPTPKDALLWACHAPLTQKQFEKLHDLMKQSEPKCPNNALHAAAPHIIDMVQNNPRFTPFYIRRVETSNNGSLKAEVREKLCNAPISLPILEVVFETYKMDGSMPPDLLIKFCHAVLRRYQTPDDKKGSRKPDADSIDVNEVINYVAKFFSSLLSLSSTNSIIQKKDASLLTEIQEFCVKFSNLSEPASLYEAICKHPRA